MDDLIKAAVARHMKDAGISPETHPRGDLIAEAKADQLREWIAAIEASGHSIVPVEPTEEFVRSLIRHLNMDPNDEGVRIAVRAALQGFLTAYGQKGE